MVASMRSPPVNQVSYEYDLPKKEDLPHPIVPWAVDPDRSAIIVQTFHNYYVRQFPQDANPISTVARNINELLVLCRALAIPVFLGVQPPRPDPADRGLFGDFFGPGLENYAPHMAISSLVHVEPTDIFTLQWRYSAFQRSDLVYRLRARGRDQLLITGLFANTDNMLTAVDAFTVDIQPFLIADAVGARDRARHDMAIAYVAEYCGVVTTTKDVLEALGHGAQTGEER